VIYDAQEAMMTLISSSMVATAERLPYSLEYVRAIAQCVTALGAAAAAAGTWCAFASLQTARKNLKAGALVKLFEGWRSEESGRAFGYINELRRTWKNLGSDTNKLARLWVQEHSGNNSQVDEPKRREENAKRRHASQFLAKMQAAVLQGLLTHQEFFSVVPEVGRYLAVLVPIEDELKKYWDEQEEKVCSTWNRTACEQRRIANWDQACPKWEFDGLMRAYEDWFPRNQDKFQPVAPRLCA
jgi:hypothetical protein